MSKPNLEEYSALNPSMSSMNAGELFFYVRRLEHEIEEARRLMRILWKSEKPEKLEKRPYRADVRVSCRDCGKDTFWRHGKGWAQCFPECRVATPRVQTTVGIPAEVWKILLDEEVD